MTTIKGEIVKPVIVAYDNDLYIPYETQTQNCIFLSLFLIMHKQAIKTDNYTDLYNIRLHNKE